MRPFRLACTLLVATASTVPAATFSDLPFDRARDQAARTHKIILVDFYATWCVPCKKLDETTWPDPAVSKLLSEKAIPLRLDAERESALAARYRVEALPTVLLLNPDGTEIDRLTGYRDPKTFVADFTAALAGPDAATRARAALANNPDDPDAHFRHGRLLATRKQYPDALAEYLWCFDHGQTASFDNTRLTILPNTILRLSHVYPPARTALESLRDARLAKVLPTSADLNLFRECIFLNNSLGQPEKNFALLDSFPKRAPARPTLTELLLPDLVAARRYRDILDSIDPLPAFNARIQKLKKELADADPKLRPTLEPFVPQLVVQIGLDYFEATAALHHDPDARAIATLILSYSNTPDTRQELTSRAARANNPSLPLPQQK